MRPPSIILNPVVKGLLFLLVLAITSLRSASQLLFRQGGKALVLLLFYHSEVSFLKIL